MEDLAIYAILLIFSVFLNRLLYGSCGLKVVHMLKISEDSFDCLNLDEDIDDGQVALGVFVNLFLYCESQRFVVQPLP